MFIECVSRIGDIFTAIHYIINGAVCFQFTQFPCDYWGNIHCHIIIIKSEVWIIIHWIGLGHETMVYAVCLSIFFYQSAMPACVTLWRQLQTRFWDASPRASVQKQQAMVFSFCHRVLTNYCWFFF